MSCTSSFVSTTTTTTTTMSVDQPLAAPRSSSYMLMLNSFASDLDSILSDLSTSPTPQCRSSSHEVNRLDIELDVTTSTTNDSHAASCPNLAVAFAALTHPPPPSSSPQSQSRDSVVISSSFTSAIAVGAAKTNKITAPVDVVDSAVSAASSLPPAPPTPHRLQSSTDDVTDSPPSEISLLERLIRSHPVWYLPNLQRVAAAQLLHNQEQGVFITRQSSQPGTLALSVKLTPQSSSAIVEVGNRQSNGALIGAGVQHYLIEAADNQQGVRLESSDFVFDNLPSLLAHYCQCCDELPVRLRLPAKIRQCSSRQNLTAIALLGQEFWSTGDNILTIPSKKKPPVPPLRLSTFDPFNTLTASGSTPNTPTIAALEPVLPPQPPLPPPPNGPAVERNKSHSPRLEARGTEPTPPPPPPRWCKPPLVPTVPVTLSPNATTTAANVSADSKGHLERREEEENGSEESGSVEQQPPLPPPVIHVQVVADEPGPVFQKKQQPARRPLMQQRRRRPRRRRSSPSGQSPHCHHSSLADKASDYEDIWGTSPGGSHDEDEDHHKVVSGGVSAQALAPKPLLAALLANQEETALSDRTAGSYRSTSSSDRNSSSSSNRSSTSSLDKATSVSSTHSHRGNSFQAAGSSRSVSVSPEPPILQLLPTEPNQERKEGEEQEADVEEDIHIEPPLLFQQPRLSTVTGSVTVVQIGSNSSPTSMIMMDDNVEEAVTNETERNMDSSDKNCPVEHNVENNKENLPSIDIEAAVVTPSLEEESTAPMVRRRTSCNSAESSKNNSRRTSPLYSEPADALPPQLAAQYWIKNQQNRPLPMPPFSSASSDFTTFTKDGYVRCTLPTLTQSIPQNSQSLHAAKTPSVTLPSSTPSSSQSAVEKQRLVTVPISGVTNSNNKSKQVGMPKPPRQLPPSGPASVEMQHNKVFPSLIYLPTVNEDNSLTIQEVLTALYPSAAISNPPSRTPTPPNASLSSRSGGVTPVHHHLPLTKQRMSAYDNLLAGSAGDLEEADQEQLDDNNGDDSSDDGTVTEFSEPWDSARWDRLLSSPSGSFRCGSSNTGRRKRSTLLPQHVDTLNTATSMSSDGGIGTLSDFETLKRSPDSAAASSRRFERAGVDPTLPPAIVTARPPPIPPLLRTRSFKDKMDPLLASPRLLALRSTCNSQAGKNLQVLVVQLGRDCTTTFGRSLQNFLQCTREAKEQRAAAVLRNVRQFISGIKNFLVQHGEPAFDSALLDIRSKLKSNEFLNVDVVLELVLHQLVTLPLRSHLYKLLGQEALTAGSVQQLVAGIRVAREVPPSSLGLKEGQPPPSADVLQRASASLERLQRAASPLDKLEQLLDACAIVYNHAAEACGEAVAAEDFLPLLAWLLAHCGFTTAEMEADFMWAMLQPSLLAGEGGYFLTALSSAAQLLKNLQSRPASPSDCGSSWMGTLTSIPECTGQSSSTTGIQQPCVLRVLVADENQSSLLARTVPLRPSMTVRDITKLLALKLRLSNPQDFTLVALIDGQEIQLPETENPQTWVMSNAAVAATASSTSSTTNSINGGSTERNCTFAFRRQDAKIAWPRQING